MWTEISGSIRDLMQKAKSRRADSRGSEVSTQIVSPKALSDERAPKSITQKSEDVPRILKTARNLGRLSFLIVLDSLLSLERLKTSGLFS